MFVEFLFDAFISFHTLNKLQVLWKQVSKQLKGQRGQEWNNHILLKQSLKAAQGVSGHFFRIKYIFGYLFHLLKWVFRHIRKSQEASALNLYHKVVYCTICRNVGAMKKYSMVLSNTSFSPICKATFAVLLY